MTRQSPPDLIWDQTPHETLVRAVPHIMHLGKSREATNSNFATKFPCNPPSRGPVVRITPATSPPRAARSGSRLPVGRFRALRGRLIQLAGALLRPGEVQDAEELLREYEVLGPENLVRPRVIQMREDD